MRLLWLGLGLAATARAETCAESPFNTDAACKATGRYDILDPQHVAVGCHEEVCTEDECCNYSSCADIDSWPYFEMYHKWFSCTSSTFVTTNGPQNAVLNKDWAGSWGWQGKTWNLRVKGNKTHEGALVSSSRNEYFTYLEHVTVYDCNHDLLMSFEIPFADMNTLYYIYNRQNLVVARVDAAWFEVSNYYVKPCLEPVLEKADCVVAEEDVDNRYVMMHKNVFSASERWAVTLLKPEAMGEIYTDVRLLSEIIVRASAEGANWCVILIVLGVLLGIGWFACAFMALQNYQRNNRGGGDPYERVQQDDAPARPVAVNMPHRQPAAANYGNNGDDAPYVPRIIR